MFNYMSRSFGMIAPIPQYLNANYIFISREAKEKNADIC